MIYNLFSFPHLATVLAEHPCEWVFSSNRMINKWTLVFLLCFRWKYAVAEVCILSIMWISTTTTTTLYLILFLALQMISILQLFQIHQDLYGVSGTDILYKKLFFISLIMGTAPTVLDQFKLKLNFWNTMWHGSILLLFLKLVNFRVKVRGHMVRWTLEHDYPIMRLFNALCMKVTYKLINWKYCFLWIRHVGFSWPFADTA